METPALTYFAQLEAEGNRWLAEFPDCPGCQTFGESREHALQRAQEALEGWLETTLELGRVVPMPVATSGEPVTIDRELAARIVESWTVPDA